MRFVFTAKGCTNALCQFVGRKRRVWLHNPTFPMSPFRFNRVEPGALHRQAAYQESHPLAAALGLAVVFSYPTSHLLADVPRRVVPYQSQHSLVHRRQLFATPLKELDSDVTDGTSVYKTQQHALVQRPVCFHPAQQQTITRQRFVIWVVCSLGALNQAQSLPRFNPCRQVGLRKTAPPSLILKAPSPSLLLRQRDYPVAPLFFRMYSGSGLVIQCLARFQETFMRLSAVLMQSSLTNRGVIPVAKLTSAANVRVHTLVSLPNSRGLRCSKAFSASDRSAVKIASAVFGRLEPICRAESPCLLNDSIALRTVWSSQPRNSAMRGALSPRALAKIIWLRRTVKASDERNPDCSRRRSSSVSSRTKIGFLMPTTIPFSRRSVTDLH